jgi:hypothetical protein
MVFNAAFNNISVMSWQSVLLLFTLKRVFWGQMIKKLKIVFISLNIFTSLIVMADINDDIQRKQETNIK